MLKLYEITNGYMGDSYVRCLIITDTKEKAIEQAKEQFKSDAKDKYKESYWEILDANCLCEDVSKGYIGEVNC
jgi:hypothetical protein